MAKPDLLNTYSKPSGERFKDGGSNSTFSLSQTNYSRSTLPIETNSGTLVSVPDNVDVLVFTGFQLHGNFVQLPTSSGNNTGRVLTLKSQLDSSYQSAALTVHPKTGESIDALPVNRAMHLSTSFASTRDVNSMTFVSTGVSWELINRTDAGTFLIL